MELAYIEKLGVIHEIADVWYDVGLKKLEALGADFTKLTARNTALARIHLPFDHEFNQRGNWVAHEIVFGLDGMNPVLLLEPGPVFYNPENIAQANKNGQDFYIDNPQLVLPSGIKIFGKQWDEALVALVREEKELLKRREITPFELRTFELPSSENFRIETQELTKIHTDRIKDLDYFYTLSESAQVAVVLFKDQVRRYAEEILLRSLILNMPVILPRRGILDKDHPYAQPLWLGSLSIGCGSCIVGCVCGNWMRGVL